jgi:DNA-binding IclR family transcriptional regulator
VAPISEQVPKVNDDETGSDSDSELNQLNRSALRAASLLISAGEHADGASAAQLALETGVPRPTAFRILLSLVHTGLLARDGGTFKLGWRTAQLGRLADPYRDILPRVQVVLDSLAADVNESVEFVMFTSPTTQETIAQASSSRLLAPSQQYVGRSFPLHATATGKILLATSTTARSAPCCPNTSRR